MSDTKMCPYCGEEIKAAAIKCKHCHTMLNEKSSASVAAAKQTEPIQQDVNRVNKSIWKRWWVWAAIILILFVAVLSMGGGGNETTSQQAPNNSTTERSAQDTNPEPEPEADTGMQFISINDKTTFADWEYKVTEVQYHNTLKDDRARGTFVVFIVEATNNSNVPRKVGRLFQLEDEKGRVFAFDSSASLAHHHTFRIDTWHLEDIGASFTATMPIAFDIPDDAEVLFLYPSGIRDEDFKTTSVVMVDRE
jgi:hypothetical protein